MNKSSSADRLNRNVPPSHLIRVKPGIVGYIPETHHHVLDTPLPPNASHDIASYGTAWLLGTDPTEQWLDPAIEAYRPVIASMALGAYLQLPDGTSLEVSITQGDAYWLAGGPDAIGMHYDAGSSSSYRRLVVSNTHGTLLGDALSPTPPYAILRLGGTTKHAAQCPPPGSTQRTLVQVTYPDQSLY